jgi:predicted acyltransferase
MGGFYAIADIWMRKAWAFPLVVIGANSIAAYFMAHMFESSTFRNLKTHLGANAFKVFGVSYESLLHGGAVLVIFWLMLYWMYRRKVFVRI